MAGRKRKCPACGGKVVPIVYGMPGERLMQDADDGKVILGGCCILDFSPDRGCLDCSWTESSVRPPWLQESRP